MCQFDPVPGFHGVLIGWPQYGLEWIFIVFPLGLGIISLFRVWPNPDRDQLYTGSYEPVRRVLIGIALGVLGGYVWAFIVEPSDSARRLWLSANEAGVSAECLAAVHAANDMALNLVGLIFILGFALPFGIGMWLLRVKRRANRSAIPTFR